jgi:ribosome-binding factor A
VTYVEVSADMRQAKVHVSIMGSDTKQQLALRGLQNAAGFLQSKVAKGIETRYTPRLEFVLDMGVKKSIQIAEILQRVLPKDASAEAGEQEAEPAEAEQADEVSRDEISRDEVSSQATAEEAEFHERAVRPRENNAQDANDLTSESRD